MKNQDQSNNQIGLEQTNSIFQLWKDLKNSIFNVLFVILNQSDDQEDQSIFGLGLEVGVDYFQMMAFPFHPAIIDVWNGGQTLKTFTSLFTNLNFGKFIPGVGLATFLIMLYALIFVIILVILDIVYVSYSFSKKKFKYTWPLVVLAKVVPLFVTVFFLPIMQTLLSVVSCQNSQKFPGIQVMQSFPDVACWQGWHMFHAVITLIFASIFVFISSIVALTIFQPRMTTNRLTARQNSTGQVIFILNKMFCQFVFSFTPFDNSWIYCIMLFLLSGWLYMTYNVDQPFYNKDASKFFRICSSYYFWTNLMLFVSQILLNFGFKGGLVIWMCGLPFIGISIIFQRKSNIDKLFSSNLKFRSGQQLEGHLQYVLQLIQNREKDKNSYMLLLGYIQKHIQICMQQDCPLKVKKIKKQQDLTEIQQNCRQLIKQLLRMYKQGVKKYPQCTRLRLSFAFFYMQRLMNNKKAYEQFSIAQNTQPSFGQQFIIYRFKKIIRQNLQQKDQDQNNDLIDIIRFDNHVSLCEQAMIFSARLHKQFWIELEQQTPDMKKLNIIGSKITQTTIAVKQNYRQITKINSHVPQVINNYALYLVFVQQLHAQGKNILQQVKRIYIQKKQTQQNDMSIFNLDNKQYQNFVSIQNIHNSMIKISVEQDSIGKIISSNQAFTQLTGYLKEDITERNIQKILPLVYHYYHTNSIKIWVKNKDKMILNCNNDYINNPHKGYIRHKSGFIVPIDYRISFDVQQCCFRALMRPDASAYNDFNCKIYIMTNSKGVVKDISPMGYMFFKISREQCQNGEYNIESLGIPFKKKKQSIFSRKGFKLKLKNLNKQKSFYQKTFTSLKNNKQENSYGQVDNELSQKLQDLIQQEQKQQDQQQQQEQQQVQGQQQFLVKGQQIWMTANQQVQQSYMQHQHVQYSDGRLKVGLIFQLQKLKMDYQIFQNNQKNKQLNIFQHLIDQIYYQQQYKFDNIDQTNIFEYTKHRKLKILASMLLQMNKGKQITFQQNKFRNYGQELKIKTYRYFNNDFKRIYSIQYQSEQLNQFDNQNDDIIGKNQIKKLQNKHYQNKIKQAINTNIEHNQIKYLRAYSFVFFIIVSALSVISFIYSINQFNKILSYTEITYNRSNDTQFITVSLQETITHTLNHSQSINVTQIMQKLKKHRLTYDPPVKTFCEMENGKTIQKSILQVMNIIQARIINYFDPLAFSNQLEIAYNNFFLSIYQNLEHYELQSKIQIDLVIVLFFLAIINCIIMLIIWIYSIMKIDQKRFDIMIWFLYIPVDYVIYLQNNCNRFIKNYIPIKQLQQKGLNMDDKQHYCDIYQTKKNQQDDGQQLDEENKARKILIARHRKKTFLSRFNLGYLKTLWLLIHSIAVISFFWAQLSYQKNKFQFVINEWQLLQQQFLWSSSFPIILQLQQLGYQNLSNSKQTLNLNDFSEQLRRNFLNTLTKRNKVSQIKKLIEQSQQISNIYSKIYYGDLCKKVIDEYDSNNQLNLNKLCSQLLSQKLRGGISTYTSYLINYNPSQIQQIVLAHYKFVGPAFMIIFKQWKKSLLLSINSFKTYSNLLIYIYVSITLISYFTFWMIYLRTQNTKMNQTIQMLNMIPINMLPKTRRDTRDFLNWLINQSNKKKQEEEE